MNIITDENGQKRIFFTLPIEKDRTKEVLGASNYSSVPKELDTKLEKLSTEGKAAVLKEFTKVSKNYGEECARFFATRLIIIVYL